MIEVRRLSLDEVVGDVPLNAAETRLITACKAGEMAWFGDELPTAGIPQNIIRAALIRHIILGGCGEVPVGPKGVRIKGAWITDVLDLQGCDSPLDLFLWDCYICETPVLMDARLGSVMLPGCMVPGLNAHRLKVVRSVLLNKSFVSEGTVNLSYAVIGDIVDCEKGKFNGVGQDALNCNGMTVGASVFLNNGFAATGLVDLIAARVNGQLNCSDGTFDGTGGEALDCDAMTVGADVFLREGFVAIGPVNLMRVQIDGNLGCPKAEFQGVLDCEGLRVGGGMYWQDVTTPPKVIDLTDAHVGTLHDDVDSWQGCTPVLNGFRYDRIIGEFSLRERLAWLQSAKTLMVERGPRGRWYVPKPVPDVDAQPYTQFARVLDGQGHRRDAAAVRHERELRVRKAQNAKKLIEAAAADAWFYHTFAARMRQGFDFCFGWMFGFGHLPIRAGYSFLAIWAFCFSLYGAAYNAGQMAPNSDVVLTSYEWMAAAEAGCSYEKEAGCEMPLHLWNTTDTATDYETFNRGLYALDLFVPLDALG